MGAILNLRGTHRNASRRVLNEQRQRKWRLGRVIVARRRDFQMDGRSRWIIAYVRRDHQLHRNWFTAAICMTTIRPKPVMAATRLSHYGWDCFQQVGVKTVLDKPANIFVAGLYWITGDEFLLFAAIDGDRIRAEITVAIQN